LVANSIGNILQIHSYGESHGASIGVVIDGIPAGLEIDEDFIQAELNKRRPGQSSISTQRNESDEFQITSGVFESLSTGHPIHITIPNSDQKSKDYDALKKVYRPSHADFTYQHKYGIRDHRGGGRSSARVTAAWVAAGAIAKMFLREVTSIQINAFVKQIHTVALDDSDSIDLDLIETNQVRCPNSEKAAEMQSLIEKARDEGDSLGGIIHATVRNCPIGLGAPVFSKLHADLGQALLSINACKGIEFGSGFASIYMKGSEYNDPFTQKGDQAGTSSNNSGGIQGGISNGEDINFNLAFRPTSSISKSQNTLDHEGKAVELAIEGRHDPCVLPRAVPIVEAMTAIVLADHYLLSKLNNLNTLK
jgi:chorismate synthase